MYRSTTWVFVVLLLAPMSTAFDGSPASYRATDTVAVVGLQNDKLPPLNPEARRKIAELALELLRSADYEAVRPLAKRRWDEVRQAPHLHLAFEPARNASFRFSTTGPANEQQVEVMEMMIPFNERSGPDYLLVREGKRVRAFAKFKPRQLETLRRALAESTPGSGQAYWPKIELQ